MTAHKVLAEIDQLWAEARSESAFGVGSETDRAFSKLYDIASKEVSDLEEQEAELSDTEEFIAAHAGCRAREAREITQGRL